MRTLAIVIMLLAAESAAHACKHKGKVLYRETQAPLDGSEDSVPNATLEIYVNGAWGWVQEMPDGQEPASQGGCLSKVQLAELKRAVAKAKFKSAAPAMCDAVPDRSVEYAAPGRKKKVRVTGPCGDNTDPTTETMAACARLATTRGGSSVGAKKMRAVCRGQSE